MTLLSELSPLATTLLSHLGSVAGEIASDVDVDELEVAVAGGLASGGGLVGVLTAVIEDSGKIFGVVKGAQAATMLASTKELLGHQAFAPPVKVRS